MGKFLIVDVIDVDGSIDLCAIDAIVVIADNLDVGEVGLEAALQEDQDIFLRRYPLALLLHLRLLNSQLFDTIRYLISNFSEVTTNLLVILKH